MRLNQEESKYLLPHFTMILAGKPASGKTSLLKQLLQNVQMYKDKFNRTLLISPSHEKFGLDKEIVAEDRTASFSLDWIFAKLEEINEEQTNLLYGQVMYDNHDVLGKKAAKVLLKK